MDNYEMVSHARDNSVVPLFLLRCRRVPRLHLRGGGLSAGSLPETPRRSALSPCTWRILRSVTINAAGINTRYVRYELGATYFPTRGV